MVLIVCPLHWAMSSDTVCVAVLCCITLMMENRRCWCILLSYRLQPSRAGQIAEVMVTPGYNPHLTHAPGSGLGLVTTY